MTLKFVGWLWNTMWHLSYAISSFLHHFIAICEFKLLQSGNAQIKANFYLAFCDIDLWHLTMIFSMDNTSANGNYSWKFHDDMMKGTLWKCYDRQMDWHTDGWTGPFIGLLKRYQCINLFSKLNGIYIFQVAIYKPIFQTDGCLLHFYLNKISNVVLISLKMEHGFKHIFI